MKGNSIYQLKILQSGQDEQITDERWNDNANIFIATEQTTPVLLVFTEMSYEFVLHWNAIGIAQVPICLA